MGVSCCVQDTLFIHVNKVVLRVEFLIFLLFLVILYNHMIIMLVIILSFLLFCLYHSYDVTSHDENDVVTIGKIVKPDLISLLSGTRDDGPMEIPMISIAIKSFTLVVVA